MGAVCLACGGPGPVPPAAAEAPALIEVTGSGQSAPAGSPVGTPLTITVLDAAGRAVPGIVVTWATDDGFIGSTGPSTDARGQSRASWILAPRLGAQTAAVSVPDLPPRTLSATATLPPAVQLAVLAGDAQSDTIEALLADTLVAIVRMSTGHGLAGVPLVWDIVAGSGEMWNFEGVTDATGRSHARWILGIRPGENRMRVRSVLTGEVVAFTATALAGAAHSIQLAPDSALLRVGETAQFTASAHDRHGNAAAGPVVWITEDPAVATLSSTGLVTAVGVGRTLVGARVGTALALRPITVY
jgi:hypothetical protein